MALAKDVPSGSIGPVYEIGPSETSFAKPAMLTFHYDPAWLNEKKASDLRVGTVEGGTWKALPDSVVDEEQKTVSATTMHLSIFGLYLNDLAICNTDTQTDPNNCGLCGHSCLGGACLGGACQPLLLASGQDAVGIAVDATTAYWVAGDNPGALMKVSKTGGKATALAGSLGEPVFLAQDAAYLYVGDRVKGVLRVAKQDASTKILTSTGVDGFGSYGGIVVAGGYVYFTTRDSVMKVPVDGSSDAAKVASGHPLAITADSSYVYWTNGATGTAEKTDGTVVRAPLGGGTETPLASGQPHAGPLAVDAQNIYWMTGNMNSGKLMKKPLSDTSSSVTLFSWENDRRAPLDMAADTSFVYWVDKYKGTVMRSPKNPGAPTVALASNQGLLQMIAVDDTAFFWTNLEGKVMKLAK